MRRALRENGLGTAVFKMYATSIVALGVGTHVVDRAAVIRCRTAVPGVFARLLESRTERESRPTVRYSNALSTPPIPIPMQRRDHTVITVSTTQIGSVDVRAWLRPGGEAVGLNAADGTDSNLDATASHQEGVDRLVVQSPCPRRLKSIRDDELNLADPGRTTEDRCLPDRVVRKCGGTARRRRRWQSERVDSGPVDTRRLQFERFRWTTVHPDCAVAVMTQVMRSVDRSFTERCATRALRLTTRWRLMRNHSVRARAAGETSWLSARLTNTIRPGASRVYDMGMCRTLRAGG